MQLSDTVGSSNAQPGPHSTILAGAGTNCGGVVSVMVTACEQVLRLPQESKNSHVRVAIAPHAPVTFVTVLTILLVTRLLHVSVAVGRSKFHALPHSTVLLPGQFGTGGVVSIPVTVCTQMNRFVQASSSSHVRVAVKPHVPKFVVVLRIFVVTGRPPQLSVGTGGSKFQTDRKSTRLNSSHVSES